MLKIKRRRVASVVRSHRRESHNAEVKGQMNTCRRRLDRAIVDEAVAAVVPDAPPVDEAVAADDDDVFWLYWPKRTNRHVRRRGGLAV